MNKRYYFVVLVILLTLVASSQNLSAQSQLAQDTYAIFETSCLNCHGTDGAFRETLLMEHSELINGGTVVPGNPDASELYKRLLGPTENGAQMPFGLPQLPAQSIETVRRWILAGAPDWAATSAPDHRFIPPSEVLTSIETHLNSLSSFDRTFARYFTMTHLYNAGETAEVLGEYRKALNKLVNSLSWGSTITNPQPIDPQATIFYIDLRHYEWDRNDGWSKIEATYPYHISFDAPAQNALREQLGRLKTQTKTGVPSVHIDWFIANASTPPLYHDLLSLPLTDRDLETRLEVDVARNLINAPGVRVWRAGFNNSGVSNHNRVVERHTSQHGAYWKSYDFAGSVGTQNIFTHPIGFAHDGGEVIFNLPNGLQGYYLANSSGSRLDEAPINIVSNPAASDPTVRNGISCIGCHTEGMKTFEDEVRSVIESNANPPYNKAQALRLYVEQSVMDARVSEDMETYRAALAATGGTFDGVEPVSRFHEAFHAPIDAAYAAAVVGLQTDTFLERVRANTGLQNVGLLALDSDSGSVKRDTWTSSFRDIISALDFPDLVGEPPIVTQPEVIPGRLIEIPDPNLRVVVEEALGTRDIRPHVMATLTSLRAGNKGVSDLTGLEYAINLEELWISGDQISDLSPLASCTKLIFLEIWDTRVRDLSPLKNLTNLEQLEFRGDIKDISPIAGLTNLKKLRFYGDGIRDISAVADMTKLTRLEIRHHELTDISALTKLTNLEYLLLFENDISNLEPLRKLTKLSTLGLGYNNVLDVSPLESLVNLSDLSLRANHISDVTPLAGLVQLYELHLSINNIADVSPLAGLTKLTRLHLDFNEIADFSPVADLPILTRFRWHDNPGYFAQAPRIGDGWLWAFLPNERLYGDTDLLAKVSDDEITEGQVATHGAIAGKAVGTDVWAYRKLPITGQNNLDVMLGRNVPDGVIFGVVSLNAPKEQNTTMYASSGNELKVWLNGELIFERLDQRWSPREWGIQYVTEFFDAALKEGRNVLLVAIGTHLESDNHSNGFFGFVPGTDYSIAPDIGYTLPQTPIHVGDTFDFDVRAEHVYDLAGWQFDLVFDPAVLEAIGVSEGDFLKSDGGTTFFQSGSIDNAAGKITGLIAGRISEGGVSGSGPVLKVRFKAKSEGESELALQNFLFGSAAKESIPAGPLEFHFTVEERLLTGDINRDGVVNILDLISVAQQLGKRVPANSPEDVNGDGVVNIFDLTLVAQGIAGAAAPTVATGRVDVSTIEAWIAEARLTDDGSIAFAQGIQNLENLLASYIPKETALLANYPNPFNPETWIPYQLSENSPVSLSIYDRAGVLIRTLSLGMQSAGFYNSRERAAYWDGRNQDGEPVASGLYFYTVRADEFTATRKMLIRK